MSATLCFAPRTDQQSIEHGDRFCPKFGADGLLPALAIDADTHEPLMLAYMNEASLLKTLELGQSVYFSRSRNELWHKGATSGQFQEIIEIRTDCDQDALILYVRQHGGGACHTGHRSCFYRRLAAPAADGVPSLVAADLDPHCGGCGI
jgi:phosphoribosyl-AMP cyclohydrolase